MLALPPSQRYVLTSTDGALAAYATPEAAALTSAEVVVLSGGTAAWRDEGGPLTQGTERLSGPVNDVYKRPYEGADNAREAMEAYLQWEYGLVAQLERDGTHKFRVI